MAIFRWPLWRARKSRKLPEGRKPRPGDAMHRLETVTKRLEAVTAMIVAELEERDEWRA